MKNIIFLLFICSQTYGQTINFTGKLLDKETNKPVVYANISFLKMNAGISSLEDGTFNLEIDKKLLQEKIHISCLNYKDTIVLVENLQQKTLFLQPKSFELNEVVISKRKNKKVIIDKVKRRVFPLHSNEIRLIGKYFSNKLENTFFIDRIDIYFPKRDSQKAKFRIRLFSVDELTGKPNEDVLNENIPISIEKGEKKVTLNLENYYLQFPKNGIYVVFEKLLIPENVYEWSFNNKNKEKYYAPVIGLTKSKEYINLNKICYFNKGNWYFVPDDKSLSVPAISLTLSN
jgi:hypothetical protein